MKKSIHIVYLLIYLISFQLQAQGQTLPQSCGGSKVRYGVSGLPNSIFQWDITGGTIVQNYNDSIDVAWAPGTVSGTLTVTEHTSFNCVAAPTSSNIAINNISLSLDKQLTVCQGNTTNINSPGSYAIYQWSNGSTDPSITVSQAGWYKLTATDNNGCTAMDSVLLSVFDSPKVHLGRDTSLCTPDITLNAGNDGTIYLWSTEERTNSIVVGERLAKQMIWVKVENENGCITQDTINILPCSVFQAEIPNTFTPNGDTYNDRWHIEGLELVPNTSVQIFDRWGRMVYSSNNGLPQDGWDGTSKGKALPMDSYYYIIKTRDGKTISGDVTIIR